MVSFVESGRLAWQTRGNTMEKCSPAKPKVQGWNPGWSGHPDRLAVDVPLVETAA